MSRRLIAPSPDGAWLAGDGCWSRTLTKKGDTAVATTVWIGCPECGQAATLEDHTIHPNGDVQPSVECPNDHCGFHEHVHLEAWTPP